MSRLTRFTATFLAFTTLSLAASTQSTPGQKGECTGPSTGGTPASTEDCKTDCSTTPSTCISAQFGGPVTTNIHFASCDGDTGNCVIGPNTKLLTVTHYECVAGPECPNQDERQCKWQVYGNPAAMAIPDCNSNP